MKYFLFDHWKKLFIGLIIILAIVLILYSIKLTVQSTFYEPVNFGTNMKTSSSEITINLDSSYTYEESFIGGLFNEFLSTFRTTNYFYDMATISTNFNGDEELKIPKGAAYYSSDLFSYYGWHKNSQEFLNTVDIDEIETLFVFGDTGIGTRFYSGWDLSYSICFFSLK